MKVPHHVGLDERGDKADSGHIDVGRAVDFTFDQQIIDQLNGQPSTQCRSPGCSPVVVLVVDLGVFLGVVLVVGLARVG